MDFHILNDQVHKYFLNEKSTYIYKKNKYTILITLHKTYKSCIQSIIICLQILNIILPKVKRKYIPKVESKYVTKVELKYVTKVAQRKY